MKKHKSRRSSKKIKISNIIETGELTTEVSPRIKKKYYEAVMPANSYKLEDTEAMKEHRKIR